MIFFSKELGKIAVVVKATVHCDFLYVIIGIN